VKLTDGSFRLRVLETGLLTLAVCLPLAALSYRFVEQPFLRRKSRRSPTHPDSAPPGARAGVAA
jgi:peptidoglycan/LPS O-acetylase OafA/YrhL